MLKKPILYALLIINFSSMICHRCGTDLLIKKLNLKNNQTFTGGNRRRLSNEYTPIKVKIDYTVLQNQNNKRIISDTNYQRFKNELDKMPGYLEKIISVKHETFNAETLRKNINLIQIANIQIQIFLL